jgi:hypothetical protein
MKRGQWLKAAILTLAVVLLFFSLYSTWLESFPNNDSKFNFSTFLRNYAINFGPEAAGIALTVLILDFLNERRNEQQLEAQLKSQLMKEMQSRHNLTALTAVEKLRVNGWLEDGTLEGINLFSANLETANLWKANLSSTNFRSTRLNKSSIRYANLQNAKNLTTEQLVNVLALRGARMPDVKIYDVSFNLTGDIEQARQQGYDPQNPSSLSDYLRITEVDYLLGQQWAFNHLISLRNSLDSSKIQNGSEEIQIAKLANKHSFDRITVLVAGGIIALISSTITLLVHKFRDKDNLQ